MTTATPTSRPTSTSSGGPPITVRRAVGPADLGAVAVLFDEYVRWNVEHVGASPLDAQPEARLERADLAGFYAPPAALLVATDAAGAIVGMAAVLPTGARAAEVRRCYVSPRARGHGAGRALVVAALDTARASGATEATLDTLPDAMPAAVGLYRSLGFEDVLHRRIAGVPIPVVTMRLLL